MLKAQDDVEEATKARQRTEAGLKGISEKGIKRHLNNELVIQRVRREAEQDARAERRPPRRLLLPFAGGPLDEGGGEGGPLDGLHLRALAPRDGVAAAGAAASPLGDLLAQLPSAPAMPPERFRAQVSRCTNYYLRLATISSC